MTKSNKGTVEKPGKDVALKSSRNKENLRQGWGIFFTLLDYKLKRKGNKLTKINPVYTSQTCNICGHRDKENRESQSIFFCKNCSNIDNADLNAAKNIKYLSYSDFKTLLRTYESINASNKTRVVLVEEEKFNKASRPF